MECRNSVSLIKPQRWIQTDEKVDECRNSVSLIKPQQEGVDLPIRR